MKMKQLIGKVKLGAKRNAPELLLVGALVTGTAGLITTGIAAVKAHKHINRHNYEKENIAENVTDMVDYNEEDAKKDLRKLYIRTGKELAKDYAIPFTLYAATIACVMGSYCVQKKRLKALSATLASVSTAYATLLTKLKNGAANGLSAKEVLDGVEVETKIDENGNVVVEKVQGEPVPTDIYKFRFDEYSTAWEKDKNMNECTLRGEENWANDVLQLQGYIFLNDVLDRLGMPRTHAGQIVGWTLDGNGDGFVDFGVKDCSTYNNPNYDDNAFDLNFNCDGDILTKFDRINEGKERLSMKKYKL